MSLSFEEKKRRAEELAEVAGTAHAAVAAEYRGLTVAEMNALRVKARESGVYMRVVKNTIARRALQGTDFECLHDSLKGPLLLAFSREDPGSAARVVHEFSKKHKELVPTTVAFGGQALPGSEVERVASLPTRDEALAQLMGVMRAPVEKLVRTLAEPEAKLVRTFAALRDKQQAA